MEGTAQIEAVLDANIDSLTISRSVPTCQKMFPVVLTKLLHYFLRDSFFYSGDRESFIEKK